MGSKSVKKCSHTLVIKEMEIKTPQEDTQKRVVKNTVKVGGWSLRGPLPGCAGTAGPSATWWQVSSLAVDAHLTHRVTARGWGEPQTHSDARGGLTGGTNL